MKKQILFSTLLLGALCLAVFAFAERSEKSTDTAELASRDIPAPEKNEIETTMGPELPEFMFDFGTRYKSIKKSALDQVSSFEDFIGREHAERIIRYSSLSVIELEDGLKTDKKISNNTGDFTAAQRSYLQSLGYSEDVLIWATYTEKWPDTGLVEDSYWTPHLTVVPEKQAQYELGKESLLDFLRVGSATFIAENLEDRVQPGRIHLTISKEGILKNVELRSTSGNKAIDHKIIELISEAPGKWIPAENSEGDKVEQELVVFYGSLGC